MAPQRLLDVLLAPSILRIYGPYLIFLVLSAYGVYITLDDFHMFSDTRRDLIARIVVSTVAGSVIAAFLRSLFFGFFGF